RAECGPMKCLSIRQPWAWAILTGQHSVEYRCYPTKYRGPLLIHAARQASEWDRKQLVQFGKRVPRWDELVFGRVVGVAELWACHACPGGEWAWCLRNPQLVEPFTLKPGKRLFEVEDCLLPRQTVELCVT
ncbi:MAG: hypothetical protein ACRELG_10205, partial [Gemmataceae bacterium]